MCNALHSSDTNQTGCVFTSKHRRSIPVNLNCSNHYKSFVVIAVPTICMLEKHATGASDGEASNMMYTHYISKPIKTYLGLSFIACQLIS